MLFLFCIFPFLQVYSLGDIYHLIAEFWSGCCRRVILWQGFDRYRACSEGRMSQRFSSERVLMPTTEACRITGFSRQHMHRLLQSGRMEGIKLGHDWLVYEDSLVAYLALPRKRGPKGPHTLPSENHPERPLAERNREGETGIG
jgi:excisionase family DNA binding protein